MDTLSVSQQQLRLTSTSQAPVRAVGRDGRGRPGRRPWGHGKPEECRGRRGVHMATDKGVLPLPVPRPRERRRRADWNQGLQAGLPVPFTAGGGRWAGLGSPGSGPCADGGRAAARHLAAASQIPGLFRIRV